MLWFTWKRCTLHDMVLFKVLHFIWCDSLESVTLYMIWSSLKCYTLYAMIHLKVLHFTWYGPLWSVTLYMLWFAWKRYTLHDMVLFKVLHFICCDSLESVTLYMIWSSLKCYTLYGGWSIVLNASRIECFCRPDFARLLVFCTLKFTVTARCSIRVVRKMSENSLQKHLNHFHFSRWSHR